MSTKYRKVRELLKADDLTTRCLMRQYGFKQMPSEDSATLYADKGLGKYKADVIRYPNPAPVKYDIAIYVKTLDDWDDSETEQISL